MMALALLGCADVVWNSRYIECNGMEAIGYSFVDGPGSRTPSLSADLDATGCGAAVEGLAWAHHEVGEALTLEYLDEEITFDGLLVEDVDGLYLHHGGTTSGQAPDLYIRWAESEPNVTDTLQAWGLARQLALLHGATPGAVGITVTDTHVSLFCEERCSPVLEVDSDAESAGITTEGDAPDGRTSIKVGGVTNLTVRGPTQITLCRVSGWEGTISTSAEVVEGCEDFP